MNESRRVTAAYPTMCRGDWIAKTTVAEIRRRDKLENSLGEESGRLRETIVLRPSHRLLDQWFARRYVGNSGNRRTPGPTIAYSLNLRLETIDLTVNGWLAQWLAVGSHPVEHFLILHYHRGQ